MDEAVRVFTSSKHYHTWIMANCARCKREKNLSFACALTMAALKSLYFEGQLSRSIAERIGFFDMGESMKSEASPVWICREFERK